jgi:hypothetical protein
MDYFPLFAEQRGGTQGGEFMGRYVPIIHIIDFQHFRIFPNKIYPLLQVNYYIYKEFFQKI